jgi:hypothetical protein
MENEMLIGALEKLIEYLHGLPDQTPEAAIEAEVEVAPEADMAALLEKKKPMEGC